MSVDKQSKIGSVVGYVLSHIALSIEGDKKLTGGNSSALHTKVLFT